MKYLSIILVTTFLFSCGNTEPTPRAEEIEGQPPQEEANSEEAVLKRDARTIGGEKSKIQLEIEAAQKRIELEQVNSVLVGYWVGEFGKNKINIALSEVGETEVKGHSICAGNYRPLTGTLELVDKGVFAFILDEPGDDKYDGRFEFTIDVFKNELKGNWTPFIAEGNSVKQYTLAKVQYAYNPSVGQYPYASERILMDQDVENMSVEELQMMRNEIYARHGYCFKNKDYRYKFEAESWYMPMGVDIREQLTDIEVENIDLIYRYEEYMDEYYDEYGR